MPIVVEPITISVAKERHMLDTTTSYNEKPAWENIAEETGITIEWMELAAGTAAERVPLMLAGGDMPDVFWALLSDAQVLQNESQLVAIEDLVDTFAPHCVATYEQLGVDWKEIATTPSGHIYGLLAATSPCMRTPATASRLSTRLGWTRLARNCPPLWTSTPKCSALSKSRTPMATASRMKSPIASPRTCGVRMPPTPWAGGALATALAAKLPAIGPPATALSSGSVNTDAYRQYLEYHHMLYSEGLMDPGRLLPEH